MKRALIMFATVVLAIPFLVATIATGFIMSIPQSFDMWKIIVAAGLGIEKE